MEKDVTEPPCCSTKNKNKCYSLQMLQIFMLFYKGEIFYKRKKDATYLIEKRMMVKTSLEFFSQIAKNVTWLPIC